MKRKILALSLVLALLAVVVTGSLAFFTDSDETTNVFTVGSVDIVQNENFVQESQLLPVVNIGLDPTADVSDDVNFVVKEVSVENIGINDAYVQTFIAVPAELDNNGLLHMHSTTAEWSAKELVATGVDSIDPSGIEYNVYKFVYSATLAANAETSNVIDGIYIDPTADLEITRDANGDAVTAYFKTANGTVLTDFNAINKLNIYVSSQAVQVKGFESSGPAAALTASFDTHPWTAS